MYRYMRLHPLRRDRASMKNVMLDRLVPVLVPVSALVC